MGEILQRRIPNEIAQSDKNRYSIIITEKAFAFKYETKTIRTFYINERERYW